MTAIISIVQSDAVHFLTDGAGEFPDRGFTPVQKVASIAHMPALIAVRGAALMVPLATLEFSMHRTFDELLDHASEALRRIEHSRSFWLNASAAGPEFDCYLGGFCRGVGWRAFVVCNHSRYEGVAPYTLKQMPDLSYAPSDQVIDDDVARITQGVDLDDFNPPTHGIQIMRAQRTAGGPPFAGGFCQLTTATEDGVRSRILERWPEDFKRTAK